MVNVRFVSTDPGAKLRTHFDGVPLALISGGAKRNLSTGEHGFTWFVIAAPGSEYSVEVKTGGTVLFTHKATIDTTMRDGGIQWITV